MQREILIPRTREEFGLGPAPVKAKDVSTKLTAAMLCVLLVACQAASIISIIEKALVIALEAATITGNVPPQYQGYVAAALAGIECASTEAATNDSAQVKSVKITACLVNVTAPVLPPGTAQNVVSLVGKLAKAIQDILTGTGSGLPQMNAKSATTTIPTPAPVTPQQRDKLLSMAKQAHDARAKLLDTK